MGTKRKFLICSHCKGSNLHVEGWPHGYWKLNGLTIEINSPASLTIDEDLWLVCDDCNLSASDDIKLKELTKTLVCL